MVLVDSFPYVQRWRKVWPSSHRHRDGGGTYQEHGNNGFLWKSASYRQNHFKFDEPISRVVVKFTGGPDYSASTSAWGIFNSGDFRNTKGGLLILERGTPASGEFSIGSGGGGHEFGITFEPVFGEAFK